MSDHTPIIEKSISLKSLLVFFTGGLSGVLFILSLVALLTGCAVEVRVHRAKELNDLVCRNWELVPFDFDVDYFCKEDQIESKEPVIPQ